MEKSAKSEPAFSDEHGELGQDQEESFITSGDQRSHGAVYGNISVQREGTDESDGQRRSLNLDDDGGTHFDHSDSLETVVRRGGPTRDENNGAASFKDAFEDNDVMFNPAQRLNFDDDDDEEEEEDEEEEVEGEESKDKGESGHNRKSAIEDTEEIDREQILDYSDREEDNDDIALVVHSENTVTEDGSDYLQHRPWVSGSDLVEDENVPVAVGLGPPHSQNVRIIEGHDSSLLDDGNPGGPNIYGYNFLQPQMGPLSPMTPLQQAGVPDSDNEAQNLYDSLERETVPSPYAAAGEDVGDTNTSEYYSLMATNSNGNISDSFWQQEEVSLQRGRVVTPQSSQLVNQNQPELKPAGAQSPPRNFQLDHVQASSSGLKDGQGFVVDGNVGEADSQDALNAELSEEGLSQNTQMYAQPLPNNTNTVELVAAGPISSSDIGDARFMGRMHALPGSQQQQQQQQQHQQQVNTRQPTSGTGFSFNSRVNNNSQPRNLAQTKPSGKSDGTTISMYSEVRPTELNMDQRQAGAGSSQSFNNANKTPAVKGNKARATGAIAKKAQIRRPAVQGSASAGELKRPSPMTNASPAVPANAAMLGKMAAISSGVRVSAQGGATAAVSQSSKQKQHQQTLSGGAAKLQTHVSASATGRHGQRDSPLASRANSHSSIASAGSSNSRVGGVGKESHQYQTAPVPPATNMTPLQPADPQFGHATIPPRMDHAAGQLKHGNVTPFNPSAGPSSTAETSGVVNQVQVHPNVPHQRGGHHQAYPQHMQELHAGDQRHFPYIANPNGGSSLICSSQAGSHGQMVAAHHLLPSGAMVAHPQALINVQAYHQAASLPSQAVSPSGSESSHHSYNREAVVTQMDAMKKGLNQSVGSGNDAYSCELQSIEDVRSHLHNMLHVGVENSMADFSGMELEQAEAASELLMDQPVNRQLHFDTDSGSVFGSNKTREDMSDILENFPAFSSKMFSDVSGVANKSDKHAHSENQYLRENLEKERYRRKHCEDQIQRLNSKLLDIQQQLAVAVSTDKRKDSMIEQLDKQLAKVVEGWKKREADKDEALKALTEEKGRIEESLQRQQTMITNFEHDLAQTVDELKDERTKSSESIQGLRKQLADSISAKEKAEDNLAASKKKHDGVLEEWEALKSSQGLAEMRAQQAQDKLVKEQDAWTRKEQELLEKISQVKEANQKVINMEKVKLEEQKKKREAAESESQDLKAELKRLVLDTEQLVREKESQKMEVSIMEAKFESAQRKLEADLHAQMEKEIADQASEFHARLESAMEEANERHRSQVGEIHRRHQKDLERQLASNNEERERREEAHKKQLSELEARLQEVRTENSNLKQSKLKLESQRMEILTKLQFMMQSQWNEAVSLLVSTPQKKGVQSSFLSATGGVAFPPSSVAPAASVLQAALNAASPHAAMTALAQPRTKPADSQGSESGRKSSASSGSGREKSAVEEQGQLDRVEEYLQRLTLPPEAHTSGDDSQASETGSNGLTASERLHEEGGKGAAVHAAQVGTSSPHQQQQQRHQHQRAPGDSPRQKQQRQQQQQNTLSGEGGGSAYDTKPSSSPSHSRPSQVGTASQRVAMHHLNGEPAVVPPPFSSPTAGCLQSASSCLPSGFQALPIRSPQQLSRLAQGVENRGQSQGQFVSAGNLPLKTSGTHEVAGKPLYPQNLNFSSQPQQQDHQQHPYQLRQENFAGAFQAISVGSQPSRSVALSVAPPHAIASSQPRGETAFHHIASHIPGVTVHVSRDSGDQAGLSYYYNTEHNPNLFNSGSPAFVSSSPSGIAPISSTSTQKPGKEQNWSPRGLAHLPRGAANQSSPEQSQRTNSFSYSLESPTKWSSQHGKRTGNVNTSLSPPVRQTAEKDQTDSVSESSSGIPDHRHDTDYGHLTDRMDRHWNRHEELQHYIQMLLQKAPGSVAMEPERDLTQDFDILESSRDLTDKIATDGDSVDLDLNDTAQAQELTSQLYRLQELRERQQGTTTNAASQDRPHQPPPPPIQVPTNGHPAISRPAHHLAEYIGDNGVMNAQGLAEISQLLSLYREQWESNPEMAKQANTASQLLEALKGVGANDSSFEVSARNDLQRQPGAKVPATRKGRDNNPTTNKVKKKAANSADVSIATTVDSLDRSQSSSKGGSVPPAAGARKGQDVTSKDGGRKVNAVGANGKQPAKGGPVWK